MIRFGYPAFFLLTIVCSSHLAQAQRPSATQLLPERTVALVRIRNVPESRTKFNSTAGGRILSDPEIGPLLSKFYEQAQEAYGRIEERVGLPLNRLLSLPQGEAWFAVVPPVKNGPVALAVLIEVGDQLPTARQLIERGEATLKENGGSKVEETLVGQQVNVFLPRGIAAPRRDEKSGRETGELALGNGSFLEFERDGAIVVTNSGALAEELLTAWTSKPESALAQNASFAAIMSRCQSSNDPPEFEWFVDPVNLAKALARGNAAAQTGLALLPALGIDGVKGVGGNVTFASGEFDSVGHAHVLLEDPKSGVLQLLQMAAGDSTPEVWVPSDVSSYLTIHWDLNTTYAKGTKVYDSFFGEGKAAQEVKTRVQSGIGIDFETELLSSLDGRFTLITWNELPAQVNSQCSMLGVKLVDAKKFQSVMEKVMGKFPERLEKKTFGSTTYYQLQPRNLAEPPEGMRQPLPCFAIVGDYVLLCDSVKFFEHCCTALGTGKSLASELDFKLVLSKIGRQPGGQKPGMISFSRPEEAMRAMYEYASSQTAKTSLAKQAENNEFFKRLDVSLKAHPLPPFTVIAKYLAPTGAMVTQDETGFHYMTFTLKRK